MRPMTLWTVCFLYAVTLTEGARILAIISIPSYSHQVAFQALWTALSRRGHEVVVLTTDPIGDPNLTNLTEIDFRFNYRLLKTLDLFKMKYTYSWFEVLRDDLWDATGRIADSILKHPEVRKMYAPSSDQKFDVMFIEILQTPALNVLAHRFNVPIIGILSLGLPSFNHYILGAPILTSHPSIWELENDTGFNLPLWQRIKNFIRVWYHLYLSFHHFIPQQQAIAEKYFGKDIPDISDIERNISVVFCNQQDVISFVRPRAPNIITFGNFHVSKNLAALPKDLKEFVDDAPNGFIYVSLGTNFVMSTFPKHVRDYFLDVFANLPCKVVWKSDSELSNKSDNIYVARWFPQQSILAHPNIRLFVYQGGLQSTGEAVYYKVPLLGLPVWADQESQVNRMVSLGVAERLNIIDLSRETINATILEILSDKRYKERMLEVNALNDRPYNMLENAVWWTEFVIRHKGAPHLHTGIAYDPWYQRYDMDIIAILSVTIFATLLCALIITYKLLKMVLKHLARTPDDIKRKID